MAEMHKLKEMLLKELREYERKGELSAGSLDVIHKITDTIKNIDKIEMLEEYGEGDESYEGGGSYARRPGSRYVHGYYRRGSYDGGGGSYGSGPYDGGTSGRRYSYDDGKEHMIRQMREMMEGAEGKHREALRECIDKMERM